jgi:hypothetical protein
MMGWTKFFPATAEQRAKTGDPRPSLAERYAGKDEYLALVRDEAGRLAAQRYIVADDIELIVANASARYDAAMAATG